MVILTKTKQIYLEEKEMVKHNCRTHKEEGKLIVPKQFDTIEDYFEGTILIKRGIHYGLINERGSMIVEPIYESVHCVSHNIFVVEQESDFKIFKIGEGILPESYTSKAAAIEVAENMN